MRTKTLISGLVVFSGVFSVCRTPAFVHSKASASGPRTSTAKCKHSNKAMTNKCQAAAKYGLFLQ